MAIYRLKGKLSVTAANQPQKGAGPAPAGVAGAPAGTLYGRITLIRRTNGTVATSLVEPPPPPVLPDAPTALAVVSVGPTTANLTWVDESYNEDNFHVQYALAGSGSWVTASDAIAEDAQSYSVTGLSSSTEYDFRVRAENVAGESAWSNTATDTTSGEIPSGSFVQLPASNYRAAYIPLEIIYPYDHAITTDSNSGHRLWQTNLEKRIPIGVLGGSPPFGYYIGENTSAAIASSLSIGEFLTPSGDKFIQNDDYGVLSGTISTPGNYTIHVVVKDQAGSEVNCQWDINVGNNYIYIDLNDSGSANLGTLTEPYNDLPSAIGVNGSDPVNQGKVLCWLAGTHVMTRGPSTAGKVAWNSTGARPLEWCNYPGTRPILDMNTGTTNDGTGMVFQFNNNAEDIMIRGLTLDGNHQWALNDTSYLFYTPPSNNLRRWTLHDVIIKNTYNYGSFKNNNSSVAYIQKGNRDNIYWDRVTFEGPNNNPATLYGMEKCVFERVSLTDTYDRSQGGDTDGSNSSGIFYLKGAGEQLSIRYFDADPDCVVFRTSLIAIAEQNGEVTNNVEVCYSRLGNSDNKACIHPVQSGPQNVIVYRCSGEEAFETTGWLTYEDNITDGNDMDANLNLTGSARDNQLGEDGYEVSDQ